MGKAIPFFKKADLDASTGVLFDGSSKVIVAIAILVDTFGLNGRVIFGTMMPDVFLTVVIPNRGLWFYYGKIVADRNDPSLTTIPVGLWAGRIFIRFYSIMLPVFISTGNADLAFKTGMLAHLVGGIIFTIDAFVIPIISRIVPADVLLGSPTRRAMVFPIIQSINGVLEIPLVGWLSLTALFVIYLGKVEVKLPAALMAIVIGSVAAWTSGVMGFGAMTESPSNLSFYTPPPALDIFNPDVVSAMIPSLPIIIVLSLSEVITGIRVVEQTEECGDTFFTTTRPLVLYDMADIVGTCFGSPLAVGLYWGYPGWKKMESGTGYHPRIVALYVLVGLAGLPATINAFTPEAVVLLILVFVGVPSYSQAFEVVGKRYHPAAIMASSPIVVDFIVDDMKEGALPGLTAFDPGSAFVELLVSCVLVFITDSNWKNTSITNGAVLALAAIEMVHSPGILGTEGYTPDVGFTRVYIALIAVLAVMHVTGFSRKKA